MWNARLYAKRLLDNVDGLAVSWLEPSEVRQLRVFGWFLLMINACIIGAGMMLGEKLDDRVAAWLVCWS